MRRNPMLGPRESCPYLEDKVCQIEYLADTGDAAGYQARLDSGWRRQGTVFFRPRCPACRACQSLRVPVDRFTPDRSQRRLARINRDVRREIGPRRPDDAVTDLYVRHHERRTETRGWPGVDRSSAALSIASFAHDPYPGEQWSFLVADRLAGVAYVDPVPTGYSAVYSFHDPDLSRRSLGTWMILEMLARARERSLPYVYLGYMIEGCRSMEYKARFRPHEILEPDGTWRAAP